MSEDTTHNDTEAGPEPTGEAGVEPLPQLPEIAPEMYFDSLMAVAKLHLRDRRKIADAIGTVADWSERRRQLDDSLREMMGEFPERTPLNAQVVAGENRKGYTVERVVLESRPRFYVTANLYLPEPQDGPVPGVLIPCGHAPEGKACETYQRVAIHLALKGFAALVYDPIGQGERVQYWRADSHEHLLGAGTPEHFADGNLCYLLGTNLAQFRVWDGMRALDYLSSRPEVDAAQLGCTGSSAGGTVTTYLAALDDRLKAAAPCCYVTTLAARFNSRRIADPEQNLLPIIATGMELTDLLALFAPKPLLIGSARRDFFPIAGARRVHQELSHLYRLLGVEDRLAMVEVDEEHGWTLGLRQAACAWMIRWLGSTEHSLVEPEIQTADETETRCFPHGNLYLHLRGTTVSDMLGNRLRELRTERSRHLAPSLTAHDCDALRDRLRRAIRCDDVAESIPVQRGPLTEHTWGVSQEIQLEAGEGVVLPATLHLPLRPAGSLPAAVLAHSAGRSEVSGQGSIAARLAEVGIAALCLDPRGVGETQSQRDDPTGAWWRDRDAELAYVALMSGIVPLGRRVSDLARGVEALRRWPGVASDQIGCIGWGRAGLWATHLAALEQGVAFAGQIGALSSYECLLSLADHRGHVADFVPRALLDYDLPQVLSLVAPRPMLVVDPLGADAQPLPREEVTALLAQASGTYEGLGAAGSLEIRVGEESPARDCVPDWIERTILSNAAV